MPAVIQDGLLVEPELRDLYAILASQCVYGSDWETITEATETVDHDRLLIAWS